MSNDCISRQAAIDTDGLDEEIRCEMCRNQMKTDRGCDGNCKYNEKLYEKIMQILDKRIKPLPSAQPYLQQTCNNLATDTISRQAAIDAMEKVDWYHINKDGQLTHGANSREDEPLYKAEDVYKVLNDMPSAQSDSCNGCKWENAFGYGECDHCKRSYSDMYEVENGKTT